MKEDKPFWQKEKPLGRVYINYDPKKKLPTHEDILSIKIEKEFKALARAVCVTAEDNQNLTIS